MSKVQKAGSILRVGFALSKRPHFHMAYLVTVCKQSSATVYQNILRGGLKKFSHHIKGRTI